MADKFLIQNLPSVTEEHETLGKHDLMIVEHEQQAYKLKVSEMYKDVLSSRMCFTSRRDGTYGPNIISAGFIDDNDDEYWSHSLTLQDRSLSAVTFNSNYVLSFYSNLSNYQPSVLTVSLASLKDIYTNGYGLLLNNNTFSVDTTKIATANAVNEIGTKVNTLTGQVNTLNGQVNTLNGQVNTLNETVSNLGNDVQTLQNNLGEYNLIQIAASKPGDYQHFINCKSDGNHTLTDYSPSNSTKLTLHNNGIYYFDLINNYSINTAIFAFTCEHKNFYCHFTLVICAKPGVYCYITGWNLSNNSDISATTYIRRSSQDTEYKPYSSNWNTSDCCQLTQYNNTSQKYVLDVKWAYQNAIFIDVNSYETVL